MLVVVVATKWLKLAMKLPQNGYPGKGHTPADTTTTELTEKLRKRRKRKKEKALIKRTCKKTESIHLPLDKNGQNSEISGCERKSIYQSQVKIGRMQNSCFCWNNEIAQIKAELEKYSDFFWWSDIQWIAMSDEVTQIGRLLLKNLIWSISSFHGALYRLHHFALCG